MLIKVSFKDKFFQLEVNPAETVGSLKRKMETLSKLPTLQQELSFQTEGKKKVLGDDMMPVKQALGQVTQLNLKNLGSQIRWEYVFYIEYFGPIVIMPLLYLLGKKDTYGDTQKIAVLLSVLHFVKRELETKYVHVFSRASMPFMRVLINCAHYWVIFALSNGIELFFFHSKPQHSRAVIATLVVFWLLFQFLNFKTHQALSSIRKQKPRLEDGYENPAKRRGLPRGWGFGTVACANYLWEVLGWITFSALTQTYASYAFTGLSMYQMTDWALKKHKAYREEFKEAYKVKKAIFPFLI